MKVVFMGTPAFAVPSLEALLAASDVVAVVTRPDQPQGRGLRVGPPPVAVAATQYALDVLQPGTLRDPGFLARLRDLGPDLFVVVAFGRIIPPDVLALASMGGINLHPSMLPRYRGAAPIPRAIAAGETATGVTVLHLSEQLDAGDIILQRAAPIHPDDTSATLEARLARDGAVAAPLGDRHRAAAERSADALLGDLVGRAQPATGVEAWISWSDPAAKIVNQVRAFDPWPVARTRRDGAPLEIWRAAALPDRGPEAPGTVVAAGREGLVVAAGLGRVRILEVQPPAGRRMPAADYLRGHPVAPGTVLGSARG